MDACSEFIARDAEFAARGVELLLVEEPSQLVPYGQHSVLNVGREAVFYRATTTTIAYPECQWIGKG